MFHDWAWQAKLDGVKTLLLHHFLQLESNHSKPKRAILQRNIGLRRNKNDSFRYFLGVYTKIATTFLNEVNLKGPCTQVFLQSWLWLKRFFFFAKWKSLVIVHLEKRRMIHKAAVVFFLSPIMGRLFTLVPQRIMVIHCGVHLMLSTIMLSKNGPAAVSYVSFRLEYIFFFLSRMA